MAHLFEERCSVSVQTHVPRECAVLHKRSILWAVVVFMLGLVSLGTYRVAGAAQLTLSWIDNSSNEDGFSIQRRIGATGTYQALATVGPNVSSYTDLNLSNNTTYCYQVDAFNSAGTSSYSNENCATTPAATFTLTVNRGGTGIGTVTSSPAGINCGSTCSTTFNSGAAVTLTATPASGSTFAGWSGTGCSTGSVTMTATTTCTATFNVTSGYTLTTRVVNQITSSGAATGRIVSNPAGIDCGTNCTGVYPKGSKVTLTPIPGANSRFTGWTGNNDCTDDDVTMNTNRNCTANFSVNLFTLSISKTGNGTVTSVPAGINCGTACSYKFTAGSSVLLHATPAQGFTFTGWSSAECSGTADCNVTLSSSTAVTAHFLGNLADKIGIYRPSTGEWFLDQNANAEWDGCNVDRCVQPFAGSDAIPVVGDWNGSGVTKVGLFAADSSQWHLDANGNGIWDGCGIDICIDSFGQSADAPVVGQWTSAGHDWIGVFRPEKATWYLDANTNGILDSCRRDKCFHLSVYTNGDLPVTGDWTGRGTTQSGFFRPSTGQWFLDRDADGAWDGCSKDLCISSFGTSGDVPVSGDWNGTGKSKIGVFRPTTGEWFLDLNGNGKWDGPAIDLYVPGYGQQGDVPVVGRW